MAMDKVLLKKLLGQGIMVTPDTAEEVTEGDYEKIMSEAERPKILDNRRLHEIRRGQKIRVISGEAQRAEVTAKDFFEYYKNKIRLLGPAIMRKLTERPVSINKMRTGQRNTLLGIVREPSENGFYLEDLTGRCEVSTRAQETRENDVIGVSGLFSGQKVFADRVVYPELPIKKEIKTTDQQAKLFFGLASGNTDEVAEKFQRTWQGEACGFLINQVPDFRELVVVASGAEHAEKKTIRAAQAKIAVMLGGKTFRVQFIQATKNDSVENLARASGKRRYVVAGKEIPAQPEDASMIDEDTDIVFLGEAENSGHANYKGYTFVSAGDRFVVIDLRTRSASLTDF